MVISLVNEKYRSIEGKIVKLPSKRSTNVENSLQIDPFYAKQSQFYPFFAPKRRFYEKQTQFQTQFKANLTQNKPNKAKKQSQFKPNFYMRLICS
jgi:hypothetical protein